MVEKIRKYYFLIILLCLVCLAIKFLGRSELVYWGGDESRHFMNGVFIRDFIADKGWRFPLEYAKWYFLKYPALSLYQYPPLFYMLEATVFFIFGISVFAVQALIFIITVVGILYWYRYVKNKFNPEVALLSIMILITSNLFLDNFSRIMLGTITIAFIMIFISYLDYWFLPKKNKALYTSLVLLLSILLLAYKSWFILLYLLLVITYRQFSDKSTVTKGLCVTAFFLTFFIVFFAFGTISQSTKIPLLYRTLHGIDMISFHKIKNLKNHINNFGIANFNFKQVFGLHIIIFLLLGLFFILKEKQIYRIRGDIFYVLSFIFIYGVCITNVDKGVFYRLNIFILPFFSFLAAYGIYNLLKIFKGKAFGFTIFCVLVFFLSEGIAHQTFYFRGYEHAAIDTISLNKDNNPILIDACHDGNFIAYIRKYDPFKKQVVFRGDKIFFVSYIYYRYIKKIYADTEEDIYKILDKYCIRYILVDKLYCEIKQKALLRKVIHDDSKFHHIKTYQISTNKDSVKKLGELDLYEYVDYKTDYDRAVKIDVPVMHTSVSFKLSDLRKPLDSEGMK